MFTCKTMSCVQTPMLVRSIKKTFIPTDDVILELSTATVMFVHEITNNYMSLRTRGTLIILDYNYLSVHGWIKEAV